MGVAEERWESLLSLKNPETVIHGPVGMFGRLEQGDLGDRGDQGAPVLESSGFKKYSICWLLKEVLGHIKLQQSSYVGCFRYFVCVFVVVFVIVFVFVFVFSY